LGRTYIFNWHKSSLSSLQTILSINDSSLLSARGLPAGTDRVHPRRATGTAGTGTAGRRVRWARVDRFFFQNRTLPVSYSCPSRVHGYHEYGYVVLGHTGRRVGNGTGRRVKRYNGFRNRYNVSANRYNDLWNVITFKQIVIMVSETVITTGTWVRARATGGGRRTAGKRVRIQRVFFKKKTDRPFSNPYTCTRLPAYTRTRVRIPRVRVVPGGF
jgi:hypothetical protein